MKLGRNLRLSLAAVLGQKTRTVLALSGVGAGVAAIVVSSAIGEGARQQVQQTIARMGTNLLIVKPLPVKRLVARREMSGLSAALDLQDYEAILALPVVARAAPGVDGRARVKAGRTAMLTTVRGTTPAFPVVRQFRIATGRFIDDEDDRARRRVVVLGERVNALLFERRQAVDRQIRIRGVPFDVIGVLAAKGATLDGADEDNQVLIPIRTALRRVFNSTWISTVYVSVADPGEMDEANSDIRTLLRARRRSPIGSTGDDFAVQDTTKVRAVQQEMTAGLSRFAVGLSAAALLVGGIGILGLMLLSVRERTSEIGLRMAVGAKPRDVLLQFLVEAAVLALAGWLGGVILGAAAATLLAVATAWALAVPASALLVSLAMAVAIGLGFGAVPAWIASRIPPIRALVSA